MGCVLVKKGKVLSMEDKEKIDFFNLLLSVESVDDLKQHVINRIKEREGYIRE